MPTSEVYNMDCMAYMKTLPDNAFDLACCDPPFGAGFTEGGGCKGWFSKYHQDADCSQSVNVERERERTRSGITASETPEACSSDTSVTRTGGTWAAKYGKKLSRGTLRREKITSKNFSASRAIRSFGAATIFPCLRPDAF